MRFTLDTDASTLTHPVQLCLVAIPMIVPNTYRKCTHFPSSKTVTSGYDSLNDDTQFPGSHGIFLEITDVVVSTVQFELKVCNSSAVDSFFRRVIEGRFSPRNEAFWDCKVKLRYSKTRTGISVMYKI